MRRFFVLAVLLGGCGWLPGSDKGGTGTNATDVPTGTSNTLTGPGTTTGTANGTSTSTSLTSGQIDADNDGFPASEDCDDNLASVNPAATDIVGDGIDQNCDGIDGTDMDGDGHASVSSGGDDCDDFDAEFNVDAEDTVGDDLDQNCDGLDGVDADGDGVASVESGGEDCEDTDATTFGEDADNDGYRWCLECDDSNPQVSPVAAEVCDGQDTDCDGVVDVDAAGVNACERLETFAVSTGEVDVLFVVDDSCSMAYTQALLDASVSNLLSPLWYATDLHLGVVTTDMSDPAKSGRLQQIQGQLWLDSLGGWTLAQGEDWMREAANRGTFGSFEEKGIDAAYAALELLNQPGGPNDGFVRSTAVQHIVLVSDEDDWSTLIDRVVFRDWALLWKTSPDMVRWHSAVSTAVGCGADVGVDYLWLATELSGLSWSICLPDYFQEMDQLAAEILPQSPTIFVLAETADPATIVVTVTEPGGVVVVLTSNDWTYDALTDTLVLTTYVPPPGSTVEIAYTAVP